MTRFSTSGVGRAILLVAALAAFACGKKPSVIDVTPRKAVIFGVGRSKDLGVRILDRKGAALPDVRATWSSSPAGVVEISGSGHLVAKKPGKAIVVVTVGKLSASVPVEVRDVASIEIIPATVRLVGPAGCTARLEVTGRTENGKPAQTGSVAWLSSNPGVAKVSADGLVTSVGPGKTVVGARMGDLLAEADIEVNIKEISRLEIRPETAIVKVGESEKFSILAYDQTGLLIADSAAQFSTLNPDLVKISGDGRAMGLAKGTATITAAIGAKTARATLLIN